MEESKKYVYKGKKANVEYEIDYSINSYYDDALDELHPDIKWNHQTFGSYQGEIISLGVDKEGNFYYKNNSYGSCSGCDWVQSIDTEEGAIEFFKQQEVLDEIGNDKEKVKEYIKKEVETSWDFEQKNLHELNEFIDKNVK